MKKQSQKNKQEADSHQPKSVLPTVKKEQIYYEKDDDADS